MMKKLCLLALLLSVGQLEANDVEITVKGRVVPPTCDVTTRNLTLNLPDIYVSKLANKGSSGNWQDFSIELHNCSVSTSNVKATFSGQAYSSRLYKSTGTAKNVQVNLQTQSGTELPPSRQHSFLVKDGRAELKLKARVYSNEGGATDGTIQTVINVTYTYE